MILDDICHHHAHVLLVPQHRDHISKDRRLGILDAIRRKILGVRVKEFSEGSIGLVNQLLVHVSKITFCARAARGAYTITCLSSMNVVAVPSGELTTA